MQFAIIRACSLITHALKEIYVPDGISMMQNGGFFDEIGHFHMHVFPRYKKDGFGWKETKGIDVNPKLQQHWKDKLIHAISALEKTQ